MWGCGDLISTQYGLHNTGEGRFLDFGRMCDQFFVWTS